MKTYFATTPLYYINDLPHLGTAYTTIATDTTCRYHALRGQKMFMLTGTDEHGMKIERVAQSKGERPLAYADRMAVPFQEAWSKLGCNYTHFTRTTSEAHKATVTEVWAKLKGRGDVYLGEYEGHYCVGCEAYYTAKELLPGDECPVHRKAVEKISETTYFFRLSKYTEKLRAFYQEHPNFIQPATRRNEVLSFVDGGLEDLSISRTSFDWGVPVPDDPSHVMYVWLDALFGYLSALSPEEREEAWPPDAQFVGKDILRFHTIYWPAFLMSLGYGPEKIPRQIYAHGFLSFNGHKMSKSLRNTVNPVTLAEAVGVDTLRYYLMRAFAFGQDGDFVVSDLIARYNTDLGNDLGNLLNRVLPQCGRLSPGQVPSGGSATETEEAHYDLIRATLESCARSYEEIQPHKALSELWKLISATNVYLERTAPWTAIKTGNKERAASILRTALESLGAISVVIWPVMPDVSGKIRTQIGLEPLKPTPNVDLWSGALSFRSGGDPIGEPVPLFPRLEADYALQILQKLGLNEQGLPPEAS